jgi:hypothetical protein
LPLPLPLPFFLEPFMLLVNIVNIGYGYNKKLIFIRVYIF